MPGVPLNKRICFISSRSGFITSANTFLLDWANGRLIHQLSLAYPGKFSVAVFSAPSKQRNQDFEIKVNNVYPLPFPFSYIGGLRNSLRIFSVLKKIERENDLLIVQLPFIGFLSLFFIKKPTVYHLCANVLTASVNPFKYKGLKLLLSKSFANIMHWCFLLIFKRDRTKVITNGSELAELYGQFSPTLAVSSSILESEIIQDHQVLKRKDEDVFNLLFIGRPSKEKGFHTLINAFLKLVKEGSKISLTLMGVSKVSLAHIIDFKIPEKQLELITFYDFVSWGDEFKSIVRSSHALAMCSVSEGTPRVLIESRALGCPVIATRVGGIPATIEDGVSGILIKPEDYNELAESIVRLYDESFRQSLIVNGLRSVKNHTLEKFSNFFLETLNELQTS